MVFCQTAKDTQGELLEMEAFYRPRGELPPPHFHPSQAEFFRVLAGEFRVKLGNEVLVYHSGDSFTVPAGTTHAMHNISNEKGHLLWQTRPALNSEGFFETVWKMEQFNPPGKRGLGKILRLAVIFQKYNREVRLANPVQRLMLQVLAPLAHIVGIKAE